MRSMQADTLNCPNCGAASSSDAPLCQFCGSRLATVACPVCFAAMFIGSKHCQRCGSAATVPEVDDSKRRNCPRCDGARRDADLCGGCHRLFFQPEQTQRELRVARVAALEERRRRLDRTATLASLLVPGAAGLAAGRPLRALASCVCFAIALGALGGRPGIVPDPWVAGAAGPAALLAVAVAAICAYLFLVASSLAARRRA